MREIIEGWQGTDAALLDELNARTIKVVNGDGMVTLAMVGNLSVELAATVNLALETILAGMPETNAAEVAQKSMLRRFLERFTVSDRGLDFANDQVRGQLTQLLTLAGLPSANIDAMLSLGASYVSPAYQALGREATQADIDATREMIAREAALAAIQQRANAADEAARTAFIAGNYPAEITAAGVAAWEAQ